MAGNSSGPGGLTARQRRFVHEYLVDANAKEAAIRAGYSARSAVTNTNKLLGRPAVREAIEALRAARRARFEVTRERVLAELARIAFADMTRLVDRAGDGAFRLKPRRGLSPDDTAAIAEVATGGYAGGPRLRLHNRQRALDSLARHLGLLAPRPSWSPEDSISDEEDQEARADLVRRLKARDAERREPPPDAAAARPGLPIPQAMEDPS